MGAGSDATTARITRACLCFVAVCGIAVTAAAQDTPPPPSPASPVITRDPDGHVTVRAIRTPTPIRIDGKLDDPIYAQVPPFGDFIQADPDFGAAPSQKTEGWIFFDDTNVYVVMRCWEDHPERIVANEMRRDNSGVFQNDYVGFSLDTFYDRRNGYAFVVNTMGGRVDGQVTDERSFNSDVNPVWEVKIGWFEGGWIMESAVPFKSLRYRPMRDQVWGLLMRRESRWMNEVSYLTPVPRAKATNGQMTFSSGATLVGIEAPRGSHRVEVKPYAITDVTTDVPTRISNSMDASGGVDLRYGVTQNLTADVTYNTDFAQVEADDQQINLTRFSLFFPEKREFFLENQGVFAFGSSGSLGGTNADMPILFYSRRIGLNGASTVPIAAGGRLTGRIGPFNVGALNIQTKADAASASPATNFSVFRLKRDVMRRSSVGVIYTARSQSQRSAGRNDAYGVDGAFSFFDNLNVNTHWARTSTAGAGGDDVSYRAQLDYSGYSYGVQAERLVVGRNFNPEVGFLRRTDIRETFGQFRYSIRPERNRFVRRYLWRTSIMQTETGSGRLDTRTADAEFDAEFHSGAKLILQPIVTHEVLPAPFRISPNVTLPVRAYDYAQIHAAFAFAPQRHRSGNFSIDRGTFYDGTRTLLGLAAGRVDLTPRFSVQPTYSLNWVDLREGSFTTRLIGSRLTYTMTPLAFVSALVQYNSSTASVAANVRFRWEYRPGSEMFVVYNEQRDTHVPSFPGLTNRALIVKVNRLFRF